MVNYNKKALPKTVEELITFLEEPHKRIECEKLEVRLGRIRSNLCSLIRHNETLIWLSLDCQDISDLAPVSEFLKDNVVLKELFLNTNRLRKLDALKEGLLENTTLTTLGLGENYITNLEPLAEVIEQNNTLRELDLFDNRIDDKNALRFFEALRNNSSVKSVNIRNNKMSKELYKEVKPAIATKPKKPLARMQSSMSGRTSMSTFGSVRNLKNKPFGSEGSEGRDDSMPSTVGSSRQESTATGKREV